MARKRFRVGLLINQIDGRYQPPIWHAIDAVCKSRDADLWIFSGKALESTLEEESQHNVIYKLVLPEQLDGLIVTSGTLSNYIGATALNKFFSTFQHLPIISLSLPMENIVSVCIDNYVGMYDAISHLIEHHNFQRIAHIKGLETNEEANERFKAYTDCLINHNIPIDPDLVYPGDFREFTAREAIREWFDNHDLRIQAISAANDDMALAAFQELKARKFRVPEDIAIIGFDDIKEMRYHTPSFTTIHQPLYQQGELAANLLLNLLEGKEVPTQNKLPAKLIVRQSCGCQNHVENNQGPKTIEEKLKLIIEEPAFLTQYIHDYMDLKNSLLSGHPGEFIGKLTAIISSRDPTLFPYKVWLKLLEFIALESNQVNRETTAEIVQGLAFIGERIEQFEGIKIVRMSDAFQSLSVVTLKLHAAHTLAHLINDLSTTLKATGIAQGFFLLYQTDNTMLTGNTWLLPKYSRLILACKNGKPFLSSNHSLSFPTREVLPQDLLSFDNRETLIFFPLFNREEHFGYLALSSEAKDDLLYEQLREQISVALQSILLYRKQKKVEEKLKTAIHILQKSEERYKEMAVLLPSIIAETKPDLTITFLNQAGMEAFDLKEPDIIKGISIMELVHPEDQERLAEYCRKILENNTPTLNEFRLIKRNGGHTVLLSKAIPTLQERKITGLRWSAIDIKPFISSVITPEDGFFKKYRFSPREKDVITYLLQGQKVKDIGDKLYVSESTVKGHITSIYSKIGVKNREELFELIKDYQVNRFGYESFVFSLLIKLFQE